VVMMVVLMVVLVVVRVVMMMMMMRIDSITSSPRGCWCPPGVAPLQPCRAVVAGPW
jgi:hypothetical protein